MQPTNLVFAQDDFKFALVTDIHISKNPSSVEDLNNTVNSINENNDIKVVFVTGDITDEGDKASLEIAKHQLDRLNVPYFAIPGNHETKWSESGATDFKYVFGCERFRYDCGNLVFMGFNSGPIIRMMDGHVSAQDIRWLENELKSVSLNKFVFILTHYPLQSGDVDNWFELTDLLRKYNVKSVLGGHYHTNKLANYEGIPAFINRSNLRAKEEVGGYSVYTINSDSILVGEQIIGKSLRKWGGYSLHHKYYNVDNSGFARPDYSVNNDYGNLKELWKIKHNAAIYSSPVVYKDKVFVGDDLGILSCFSLNDGKLLWQFFSKDRILGTPAVAENIVVFGSTDHYIYGVNVTDGSLKWKVKTDAAVIGAATIEKNRVYIGNGEGIIFCLDIKNGDFIWQNDVADNYIETKPLIYKELLIFGAWDTYMYALDKKTGNFRWKWNNGNSRMHFSPAAVLPVASNNKVFFTAPDRVITALNYKSGDVIWRYSGSKVRETIGLSADNKRVYSKTMQDSVVCFAAKEKYPKRIWTTDVGYGYDHAPTMPVEKDGVVYGSTKNGLIFALKAKSGELLWKHKIGNSLINTVVPLGDGWVLLTSAEGWVALVISG
ncbi:PQQ-binding-like beta-propeller repeat protein [Paludibacter sp.]